MLPLRVGLVAIEHENAECGCGTDRESGMSCFKPLVFGFLAMSRAIVISNPREMMADGGETLE